MRGREGEKVPPLSPLPWARVIEEMDGIDIFIDIGTVQILDEALRVPMPKAYKSIIGCMHLKSILLKINVSLFISTGTNFIPVCVRSTIRLIT